MAKLTLVIFFGVMAMAVTAEKRVGQPCVSGSNTGVPAPTASTPCADAGATRATHNASDSGHAPACYRANETLPLMNETMLHGVRCYSPSSGYGKCEDGAQNYTTAVDYCIGLGSDYRLAFTNDEQGQMCANGCGLDSVTAMMWYGDSATQPSTSPTKSTMSPTMSPTTMSPTTKSPTGSPTTASPTTSPTTSPTGAPTKIGTTLSPTASPDTLSPTASPTASPTNSTPSNSTPTTFVAPTSGAAATLAANLLSLAATTMMIIIF